MRLSYGIPQYAGASCRPSQFSPRVLPAPRPRTVISSVSIDDSIADTISSLILPTLVPCLASALLTLGVAMQPSTSAAILSPSPAAKVEQSQSHSVRLEDVANPLLKEGVRAATKHDFVKAEAIFSAMLQQNEASDIKLRASLWSNLGNVHLSSGRPEIAVQDYEEAINLAPKEAVPYINRAIAREELGFKLQQSQNPEKANEMWMLAVEDCDDAITRDSSEFAAYANKGNVMMRLNDFAAASQCFSRAADLAPTIAGYRLRAAQLQFQQGDTAEAIKTVQSLERKHADYSEAKITLAAMLCSEGQLSEAEGEFNAALKLDPHWRDIKYAKRNTWPPALLAATEKLLTLEVPSSDAAPGLSAQVEAI